MLNTCKVDKANNRKVSHNFDRARFDQNSGKQRINTRSREKIGESPRRRINVFTGQVRNIAWASTARWLFMQMYNRIILKSSFFQHCWKHWNSLYETPRRKDKWGSFAWFFISTSVHFQFFSFLFQNTDRLLCWIQKTLWKAHFFELCYHLSSFLGGLYLTYFRVVCLCVRFFQHFDACFLPSCPRIERCRGLRK